MLRKFMNFTAVSAICLLTACSGEELVQVPYEGTPYAQERTAGFGVAYVRASMAPARGLNTGEGEDLGVSNLREIDAMEPVEEAEVIEPAEPTMERVEEFEPMPESEPEPPMKKADDMFNQQQRK